MIHVEFVDQLISGIIIKNYLLHHTIKKVVCKSNDLK